MPHATKGAWVRPRAPPPPPPKPIDPIASNMGLLQYFAGSSPRQRSTSPTKLPPPTKRPSAVQQSNGKRTDTPPKVKLPKGLGLEGLEALQYRPPPPSSSLPRDVEVVEVVEERTEYDDEEEEDVVIVHPPPPPRVPRLHPSALPPPQPRSFYRPPPQHQSVAAFTRPDPSSPRPATGPIAHVSTARHVVVPDPPAAGARAALERGIRERKLERFGRGDGGLGGWRGEERGERGWRGEERGWREERGVVRLGSGSRAMREAITPLVM